MIIIHGAHSFQLYDQFIGYKQIRIQITEYCAILIINGNRSLLHNIHIRFFQTMGQAILIDLLKMPVPQMLVQSIRTLSNHIT